MTEQREAAATAADRVNAKIENRIATRDFLASLESAYVVRQTTINTPVIKRVYLRFFDPTQLNMHIISVYGRVGLSEEQVVQVEEGVRKSLADADAYLNEKLNECAALFQANGISASAKHLAPKQFDARVISPLSSKYLKLLVKADQLIAMIEVLVIEDIIRTTRGEMLIAEVRNRLRKIATSVRTIALGVRRMVQAGLQNTQAAKTPSNGTEHSSAESSLSIEPQEARTPNIDTAAAAVTIAKQERKRARDKRSPAASHHAALRDSAEAAE